MERIINNSLKAFGLDKSTVIHGGRHAENVECLRFICWLLTNEGYSSNAINKAIQRKIGAARYHAKKYDFLLKHDSEIKKRHGEIMKKLFTYEVYSFLDSIDFTVIDYNKRVNHIVHENNSFVIDFYITIDYEAEIITEKVNVKRCDIEIIELRFWAADDEVQFPEKAYEYLLNLLKNYVRS